MAKYNGEDGDRFVNNGDKDSNPPPGESSELANSGSQSENCGRDEKKDLKKVGEQGDRQREVHIEGEHASENRKR